MINAITAQSALSTSKPQGQPVGQGFSALLDLPPVQTLPPDLLSLAQTPLLGDLVLPFHDSSPAAEAERTRASGHFQDLSLAYSDVIRSIFTLVEDSTGIPISESVAFRRSGDHFRVFSTRQRADGAEDSPTFRHPQGDLLEAVLNGSDPELAELSKKVKALLEQADAMLPKLNEALDDLNLAYGMEPGAPLIADGDFVFAMPTRFVAAGRRMAEGAPKDFENFRASLTPDDLGRMSENQIYSRYFVSRASKEQMMAALAEEKQAKSADA